MRNYSRFRNIDMANNLIPGLAVSHISRYQYAPCVDAVSENYTSMAGIRIRVRSPGGR